MEIISYNTKDGFVVLNIITASLYSLQVDTDMGVAVEIVFSEKWVPANEIQLTYKPIPILYIKATGCFSAPKQSYDLKLHPLVKPKDTYH